MSVRCYRHCSLDLGVEGVRNLHAIYASSGLAQFVRRLCAVCAQFPIILALHSLFESTRHLLESSPKEGQSPRGESRNSLQVDIENKTG